ncbi:MAG: phosphate acyltransferase, partial [bacterium]
GCQHPTADTIRASLYSVGLQPDSSIISSFFVMILPNKSIGEKGIVFYADCGVIPQPTTEQLAHIAMDTSQSFRKLVNKEPRVAMLSFSTKGSGHHTDVDKVRAATELVKAARPNLFIDGEMQFDAAIVPKVAQKKAPGSKVAGYANVLIFPDLDAGNIGYKITERLAGATALGPLFQGVAKPINDLSRGCSAEDIVSIAVITAIQAG